MSARLRTWLAIAGALALVVALVAGGADARAALRQSWPPFVLVAGLLLIGLVADGDGLFEAAAARVGRLPGPPAALLVACYALVALVTAVLNLDTAVVFLTPVLIHVARRRGLDAAPFVYGSVFMANSSSLFLPGSNLTNLLVLSGEHVSGATFATRMLPAALTAAGVTAAGLVVIHRRRLAGGAVVGFPPAAAPPLRVGLGLAGALAAAALMVALRNAALPVLGIGMAAVAWRVREGALKPGRALAHVNLPVLVGVFGAAVALGTVARASSLPGRLMRSAGRWPTAAIAAVVAVLINNLPAAVLLASSRPAHPGRCWSASTWGPTWRLRDRCPRSCGCRPRMRPANGRRSPPTLARARCWSPPRWPPAWR